VLPTNVSYLRHSFVLVTRAQVSFVRHEGLYAYKVLYRTQRQTKSKNEKKKTKNKGKITVLCAQQNKDSNFYGAFVR
jgi:hypothetical protein